ncbi:MAG TPA: plasmid pRiA4b ORF-3 family protein, partial [Acidothermaceae bacterium]|nr:plasmid pRiA4b ORF-3 family protein [Acidothermaceae bacterium]
ERFGVRDPELDFSDERKVTLGELTDIGTRFRYTYDFGDDWHHEILVDAKGACPPEDCGGVWGYADLKEILADPSHDEHQERLEWLELDDANEFDPNAVPTGTIDHELALTGVSR